MPTSVDLSKLKVTVKMPKGRLLVVRAAVSLIGVAVQAGLASEERGKELLNPLVLWLIRGTKLHTEKSGGSHANND